MRGRDEGLRHSLSIRHKRPLAKIHHYGVIFPTVEKRRPTHDLDAFKAACADPRRFRATGSAVRDAVSLGFDSADMLSTILLMRRSQFYKSMTAYADHRVWQDVYHVPSRAGTLYVKFTADAVTEFLLLSFNLLLSFKEKDDA